MRCSLFVWIVFGTVKGYESRTSIQPDESCSVNCTCNHVTMECVEISELIPLHIQTVIIQQTADMMLRMPNIDCRFGWQQVKRMEINAHELYLGNFTMDSCSNPTHLKFNVTGRFIMEKYAFIGLDSLVELDLSGNGLLLMHDLILALHPPDNRSILQNLKILNIRRVQSAVVVSINLDETFFDAVTTGRHLQQIDVSETNIGVLDCSGAVRFCETVETLIMQNCTISSAFNIERSTCRSLTTLDLSGTFIPLTRQVMTFITARFSCMGLRMFFGVHNLILNNLIEDKISPMLLIGELEHYHLDMTNCDWNLTHIYLRNNNIRFINMTAALSTTMEEEIRYMDISYNILEYIHPAALSPLKNINFLDVSHNRLHMMQTTHYQEFCTLFQPLQNLKILNMSHNDLTNLPTDILQQISHLEVLNLAYNNINSITFNIEHLTSLRYLNLRSNNIQFIDAQILNQLRKFTGMLSIENKEKFLFDISENKFICGCDEKYVKSIEWIQTSDAIDLETSDYTCTMEDQTWNIDQTTVKALNHHCLMKTVKLVLLVGIPTIISLLAVLIVIKLLLKKHYARQQTFNETLIEIKNGTFPWKYLTFVSFCSENEEIVREHIIPQLIQNIHEITGAERELVSAGDMHIRPGFPIRSELVECILNSSVTIIIVSNEYCQKQCCQIEVEESYNLNKPIILIMLEKVEPHHMGKTLTKIFQQYTHASWVQDENGGHLQPNVTQLVNSMITLAGNNKKYIQPNDATDIELELL